MKILKAEKGPFSAQVINLMKKDKAPFLRNKITYRDPIRAFPFDTVEQTKS